MDQREGEGSPLGHTHARTRTRTHARARARTHTHKILSDVAARAAACYVRCNVAQRGAITGALLRSSTPRTTCTPPSSSWAGEPYCALLRALLRIIAYHGSLLRLVAGLIADYCLSRLNYCALSASLVADYCSFLWLIAAPCCDCVCCAIITPYCAL